MRKAIRRLLTAVVLIILLLGGAAWWLLSYIAPDEPLDMAYESIDVKEKALDMAKRLKPEFVLTEADINNMIKMHLERKLASREAGASSMELANGIHLDGAAFELEEDKLAARLNVTYRDRVPAELDAVYSLEWQPPNIALRPNSLSVKEIGLPVSLLEPIIIPLDLPADDVVTVRDVQFLKDQIKVLLKISLLSAVAEE
ncbi:hypothetical protein [Paenibacillus prosopidis]|uniref:Uncharacterized protein n=1 Tax=Paenibacillus prosopidis TaxID=630520 RepID=A0A368W1Y0_9BACL|nr:hypothetical protein [Paenibacillus prosopidis]RCW47825.1 hypothetical protein DFP97_10724 [Paenibacillus prosopidis]